MDNMRSYTKAGRWAVRVLTITLSVMLIITMMPMNGFSRVHAEPKPVAAAEEFPAFSQQAEVDGCLVSAEAPEGLFPADATLDVSKVTDKALLAKAVEALDKVREEGTDPLLSYVFDIKVLDAEGNALEPAEGQTADLSFVFSEKVDQVPGVSVYRITDTGEDTAWNAEQQDSNWNVETNTVEVNTDRFSLYAVEFTGKSLLQKRDADPFSQYWNEESQQYSLSGGTYKLTEDFEAMGRIYIRYGTEVTIDLGGMTLSGRTGGEPINFGGVIANDGTLTVKNGTISGGNAKYGGGIYNYDAGTLTVEDVTITGNTATNNGGGIYCDVVDGDYESKVTISGATITENEAGGKGGGIYCGGTLSMSGKVIVENNESTNLYLEKDRLINVTGAFEEGSSIGVTGVDYPCYLTSGLAAGGNKSIEMFTLDNAPDDVTLMLSGGELYARRTDESVDSWAALQAAVDAATDNTRTVIELSGDCTASKDQDRIQIRKNKIIELDLAGHTLNRNRTSSHSDGHVIEVFGKLTVIDTRGNGQIKGGFAKRGGGINISEDGVCELKSGTIKENKASSDGGGVYVHGTFKMSGGSVSGNETTGKDSDGGGIYVDGDDKATLTITGGLISSNTTDNNDDKGGHGAGIMATSGAKLSISNATFDNNWSRKKGAALHTEVSVDINNCTFRSNHPTAIASTKEEYDPINHYYYFRLDDTYDGGAIYIDDDDAVVNINDSKFTGNFITNYAWQYNHGNGGAIYLNDGKLNIRDSVFENNKSWEGGAIYVDSGTTASAENTTFKGNNLGITAKYSDDLAPKKIPVSSRGGGAISNYGTLTLEDCTFTGNYLTDDTEDARGGAIYSEGTLTMNDVTFTGNRGRDGGALYLKSGQPNLTNCTIKDNSASMIGGGVYVATGKPFNVKGKTLIKDNSATRGNDVYLPSGKVITLTGALSGSDIGVALEKIEGVFTSGFSTYHSGDVPEAIFYSCDGYDVVLKNNEGCIQKGTLDDTGKFINWKDQINYNANRLSGPNWMSGLSGERYLNEINIPGTHDSSMNHVSSKGCLSGEIGKYQATTQVEYINDQLEHGIRFFDIRMKTKYCASEINIGGIAFGASIGIAIPVAFIPVVGVPLASLFLVAGSALLLNESTMPKFKDDGVNLWACHGRSAAGTFYALDQKGDRLSLAKELEWMKAFLKNHPTETIIIDARPETDEPGGDEYYEVFDRFNGIMEELTREKNPATGESYVYWEDGKVGKRFTHWPQLKDCRGKIVLWGKLELTADTIGGIWRDIDGIETKVPAGTYKDGSARANNLVNFFRQYNKQKIPKNAMNGQMKEFYWIEMNTTDTMFLVNPVDLAKQYTLPAVFGSSGLVNETKKGTYFGWFGIDAARANHSRDVWITNFPDDLDYCRVTVESGLSGSNAPEPQIYKLLRGTTITIPGCIYDGTKADKFIGWEADSDGKTYTMNSTYRIEKDVTFTAQWSDQIKTPVTVVWKDADDLDNKRPDDLVISYNYNGAKEETVEASKEWTCVLTGDFTGDPELKTVPEGYTARVEGEKGKDGYTITMVHTPGVSVNASGTVAWDDRENKDGIRPDSVTLHLYADGTEAASGTATKDNGWSFNLGEFPRYKDGELVAYKLVEDEIDVDEDEYCSGYRNGVEPVSGEKNAITEFKVTNTHEVTTSMMYARIEWDDDNDAAGERPESVKVTWMKNGKPYGDPIVVEPGDEGEWVVGLELTYAEMKKLGETQGAIYQRYQAGEINREEFLAAMEETMAYTIEQDHVEGYTTAIDWKEGEKTEDGNADSYIQIRNTYGKHSLTFYKDTEGKEVWQKKLLNDGTSLKKYAEYGLKAPDILEKEGYTFAGWATEPGIVVNSYCDKNGDLDPKLEGKLVDWNAEMSEDMDVYPIWIRDRLNVVIVPGGDDPDGDDVNIDDAQSRNFTVNIDEKIVMRYLAKATREGYELDGWYTKEGVLWNGENWKTLKYVSEGWTETEGWGVTPEYCDKNENGDPVVRTNAERKFNYYTVTLTASWIPAKVTVRYDLGDHAASGAAVPDSSALTLGNTATLAAAPDTANEYIFTGWKAPDGKQYSAGGTFLFDDWTAQVDPDADPPSITMTAQYTEKAKVRLIFDANGGTAVEPLTGHEGNSIDLNESRFSTARTGYDFDGWYNSAGDKCEETYTFMANETLTAHWKVKRCTITFESAGGTGIEPISQDFDTPIKAPEDPKKEHYTFAGWVPALPKTMPAENITVKAGWVPKNYKIIFDTDGGSEIADIEDIYGARVTKPESPTKSGYAFEGWMDENSEPADLPSYMPDTNPTYKAKWKKLDPLPQGHKHKLTKVAAVRATCTKAGNITYWICDQGENPCGRYFADSKGKKAISKNATIAGATGHKWGKWTKLDSKQHQRVCSNDRRHVQKKNHTWDGGKVTKKATIEKTGTRTFTCTACKATKTESIPKLKDALAVTVKAKGETSLVVSWSKVDGAEGYDLFFGRCNGKSSSSMKKLKTLKGNGSLSWTVKGLKKHKGYKAYVKAWKKKGGKKTYIKTSLTFHAFASGGSKNYTNPKSVKVNKKKVTLKVGKTFRIKAKVTKLNKKKKLISKKHAPKLRYQSSDKKIATVSSSGRIKAKAKGTCRIYVYAASGVCKQITVTVK